VRRFVPLLLAAPLLACGREERSPMPPPLLLQQISPRNTQGVFLNEELIFEFNQELDRSSVTSESVAILSSDGTRARGEFSTQGHKLHFKPLLPCQADLCDGGFLPGQDYRVLLGGFPRPDALRSASGAHLDRSRIWGFRTVEPDQPRRQLIFYDENLERIGPPHLFPKGSGSSNYLLAPDDYLYLACDKPVDPTSLLSRNFYLSVSVPGSVTSPRNYRRVQVQVRLLENHPDSQRRAKPVGVRSAAAPEAWLSDPRAALIELVPLEALRPGERGTLRFQPDGGLDSFAMRDFSARPLLAVEYTFPRSLQVTSSVPQFHVGSLVEEFLDHNLRTSISAPSSEGTATWSNTGRIEISYPLAAGSGAEGEVVLAAEELRRDLQTTSLVLPPSTDCTLSGADGLVVLRAQGRMHLQGTLRRKGALREPLVCPEGLSLSAWLESARAREQQATVLIAGADLVIDGRIECDTPLLLVAGGQIRVRDPESWSLPQARNKDEAVLWLLGGAGAPLIVHSAQRSAALFLDPPHGRNPLRQPLTYSVLSGPLPPTGRVGYWRSASATGWLAALETGTRRSSGIPSSWRVRFLPDGDPSQTDFSKAVPNPILLEKQGSVRMWVELTVGTTAEWNPPFVDSVSLSWEQAEEPR